MARIVYIAPWPDGNTGGLKVIFRHVEALNRLGFTAVVRGPKGGQPPGWFRHDAAFEDDAAPLDDADILVLPEDALDTLKACADVSNPKVVFCQNPSAMLGHGFARLPEKAKMRYRHFMACSQGVAATMAQFFDYDLISVVPAFADERIFKPLPKARVIACTPRKRAAEYMAIRYMFQRIYRGVSPWKWEVLETASEDEVAAVMGRASVFLNLGRMEAASITTLEAMACGCLIAGFTGVGPREYMTPTNGLWVGEDECEAAARALIRAVGMAEADGGPAAIMRHAAVTTAGQWSHAAFVPALESFWTERMGVTR